MVNFVGHSNGHNKKRARTKLGESETDLCLQSPTALYPAVSLWLPFSEVELVVLVLLDDTKDRKRKIDNRK